MSLIMAANIYFRLIDEVLKFFERQFVMEKIDVDEPRQKKLQ